MQKARWDDAISLFFRPYVLEKDGGSKVGQSHGMGEFVARKKRISSRTPLSIFLSRELRFSAMSLKEAAAIAGCSPSVIHAWLNGSYPAESIVALKKLANYFGYSLSLAISGEPDDLQALNGPSPTLAISWVVRFPVTSFAEAISRF